MSSTKTGKKNNNEIVRISVVSKKASFEVPPRPIPEKDIKETAIADVVVVGAGISGLTAAVSAAEAGAKTVLIEKAASYNARGLHNVAINSSLQREAGIKNDRDEIISTIMEWGGFRTDQRVVTTWADNCDKILAWLIEKAKAADVDVYLDPTTKPWYFKNYGVAHMFWTKEPDRPKAQEALAGILHSNAQALGVDLHFETPAVRLLRKGKGRVTGVIAQSKSGYVQFNASKAVVLCTGDYGSDHEMIKKYCNQADVLCSLKLEYEAMHGRLNTGDGHKMGMWIGAAIDDAPHMPMLFDFAVFSHKGLFNLGRQPWLYVNVDGERFMNEDLPWGHECNQILRQPGRVVWSIWDAKYNDEWPKMKSQCCKNMGPPLYRWGPELLDKALERGYVLTAPTLEELAQKMEVSIETFKATAARYTELARNGKDLDFGKHPDRLTTLEKPPFYACQFEARLMVVLSGLQINPKLQVIDTEGNAIPGLYAAGNVSGSFFGGNIYPTVLPGLTHSRAWTFGWLAGLNAATEKV